MVQRWHNPPEARWCRQPPSQSSSPAACCAVLEPAACSAWLGKSGSSGQNFRCAELVKRVRERARRILIGSETKITALGHVGKVLDHTSKVGVRMPPRSNAVEWIVLQAMLGNDLVPDRLHACHLLFK